MKRLHTSSILLAMLWLWSQRADAEVLIVRAWGTPAVPSSPLEAGKDYIVEARGTYLATPRPFGLSTYADAEFFSTGGGSWNDPGPNYELWIDGKPRDGLGDFKSWWGLQTQQPQGLALFAPLYSPMHVYRTLVSGTGEPLTFQIHEPWAGGMTPWDNSGELTVHIVRAPAQQPRPRNLVLYTHGWNTPQKDFYSATNKWVQLQWALEDFLKGSDDWAVTGYEWTKDSGTIISDPIALKALEKGAEHGERLGKRLAKAEYDHVHFIAHSAGANLITKAAIALDSAPIDTTIHSTFLDPYAPSQSYTDSYGAGSDWSDNYFVRDLTGSGTEPTLSLAHNVDVTKLYDKPEHGSPISFYTRTISEPGWQPEFGFARSREAGGWADRYAYPPNNVPVLLTDPGAPHEMPSATERYFDSILVAQEPYIASPGDTVGVVGSTIDVRTGSPAWISIALNVAEPVNLLKFDAEFVSDVGGEGLLAVYWDEAVLGVVDERYILDGTREYLFRLPELFDPGMYELAFRLDPYTDVPSHVVIDNIRTGYVGVVPEPSTLIMLIVGGLALFAYTWGSRRASRPRLASCA